MEDWYSATWTGDQFWAAGGGANSQPTQPDQLEDSVKDVVHVQPALFQRDSEEYSVEDKADHNIMNRKCKIYLCQCFIFLTFPFNFLVQLISLSFV